jgi:hypothetical protein
MYEIKNAGKNRVTANAWRRYAWAASRQLLTASRTFAVRGPMGPSVANPT